MRLVLFSVSPLVGSVVRFVLHLGPVRYCPTFLRHVLCLSSLSFHHPTTCLLGKSLRLRPRQSVSYGGVSLGRSGRVFINGSLGWSTYCSDVLVLQRFLGLLLKKNGRHCLWWQKSTLPVFIWSWGLGGRYMDDIQLFLSLVAKVYAPRLHLVMRSGR